MFHISKNTESPITTDVKEYILDNGLTIWLNEDHSQPKVFGAIVVKAGAKDCPNTGIAHYFEHIMFKGTEHIGTVNYPAEKVFLDRIADKYDELSKTDDELKRIKIQQEINDLSLLAADYVIPNEFDKLISKYGGSKLNAGTSYDYTVYHNTFSPQYTEQWAELNSERLLCPVFRMFQSELETVYEEKNRRDDMMFNQAMEKAIEMYFYPHPYAYPVIGSADNLKNPRLSEMRKFFEKYYIANNMGVIISGDFDSEKMLPILSKAFSRIPRGEEPLRYKVTIPQFHGREKRSVKIPVPFMKVMAMGFRGVPANHPDEAALNIVVSLLNNSNGTGFLDRLTVNHRLMGAMAGVEALNEAGILGVIVLPKVVIQAYGSAEKLIWKQINHIRNGEFSKEMFESIKQEQMRKHITDLEDIDSRSRVMIRLFTQGKKWEDYINELQRADAITKSDVVDIANKYFDENYLFIKKKTGKYVREYLPKPNFAPIVPKHSDATSDYAQLLEKMPVQEVNTRFIDFKNDAATVVLSDKATLYVSKNPVNNIFTLCIAYGIGIIEEPWLKHLTSYLSLLGTDKYTFEELRTKLQTLGSLMLFDADKNHFQINISGFDRNFEETIAILSEFLQHVKYDKRKLKTLVDDEKVSEKAFFKSSNEIADALFEYVEYGTQSQYIRKHSYKEVKRLKGPELIEIFKRVQKVQCNFHYCGTKDIDFVSKKIKQYIPLENITEDSHIPFYREPIVYDKPLIFFYDMRDVSQNILYGYQIGVPLDSQDERCRARLFSEYFGGGMSSLIFQEIREFRSYAYQTSGGVQVPPFRFVGKPSRFVTFLSTQSDKTIDAMTVLESLVKRMPVHPEKMDAIIQSIINQINSEYPTFRDISKRIAQYRQVGFYDDPNRFLVNTIKNMTIDDVVEFHETYIKDKVFVYAMVGNSRKMNMSKLASFGEVVFVKRQDFFK